MIEPPTPAKTTHGRASYPTSIILSDLFPTHPDGKQTFAQGANGQLVCIDDVESGLACQCSCPGCGKEMVAHKGRLRRHFQHRAEAPDCKSAGETALHKFAKDVLGKALRLRLPPLAEGSLTVVRGQEFEFDEAFLEYSQIKIVVPDVICRKRDRYLHVEFKVTHACGHEKKERLKKLDVGAIEVDLSAHRDASLELLEEIILYGAPRIWLHNPLTARARKELVELEKQRLNGLAKQARAMLAGLPKTGSESHQLGVWERKATDSGLGGLVCEEGRAIGFTVGEREWRSFILVNFGLSNRTFGLEEVYEAIKGLGWVCKGFEYVDEEMAIILRDVSSRNVQAPWHAIVDFMERSDGLIDKTFTGQMLGRAVLHDLARADFERKERPQKRREELRNLVESILSYVRPTFKEDFSFENWLQTELTNGEKPASLIGKDYLSFASLLKGLNKILRELNELQGGHCESFGLPVQAELEARREKKLIADAESREYKLSAAAERELNDAIVWLGEPHSSLSNVSPGQAARDSRRGFEQSMLLLKKVAEERRQVHERESLRLCCLAALKKQAFSHFHRDNMAEFWMKTGAKELGGKSPEDFCRDESTLDTCTEILRSPAKRKR